MSTFIEVEVSLGSNPMGEMADFALEEVEHMEELRRQHRNFEMPMEESFELGFLDPSGAETDFIRGGYSGPSNHAQAVNQQTTKNYLDGFKKFYEERGFLSDKQRAVIRTNYPGGDEQFTKDIDNE